MIIFCYDSDDDDHGDVVEYDLDNNKMLIIYYVGIVVFDIIMFYLL